jgi:hypothetical protein
MILFSLLLRFVNAHSVGDSHGSEPHECSGAHVGDASATYETLSRRYLHRLNTHKFASATEVFEAFAKYQTAVLANKEDASRNAKAILFKGESAFEICVY